MQCRVLLVILVIHNDKIFVIGDGGGESGVYGTGSDELMMIVVMVPVIVAIMMRMHDGGLVVVVAVVTVLAELGR